MRITLFPIDQLAQCQRLRLTLGSGAFYTLAAVVLLLVHWKGWLPAHALAIYSISYLLVVTTFFVLIRTGWNLRLKDPSLAETQVICSAILCAYTLIYTGPFRGVLMLAFVIGLMFGGTHMAGKRLFRLAAVSAGLYVIAAGVAWYRNPEQVDWGVEFINWVALCTILAFTAMLSSYLSRLRAKLRASNEQLSAAMARLSDMAARDELTGQYNRRHLLEVLAQEKNRADRGGCETFCVCLLDIDHFKHINDNFGHSNGDTVLRTFAKVIEHCIRAGDTVARWGGEEFLLLLPQSSGVPAEACIRRITARLKETAFDGLPPDLRITVSVGIAEYRAGGAINALIDSADQALYRAKRDGRNRVVKAQADAVLTGLTGTPL